MSRVKDTIRQLIADRGRAVLDDPDVLLGMLEDYGAFRDEDPKSREALRNRIKAGGANDLLVHQDINPVRQDAVDTVDWGAVLRSGRPDKRTRPNSQLPKVKSNSQPPKVKNVSPAQSKPPRQKSKSSFRKWLSDNSDDICIVFWWICIVLAVISLFATFCCLIYSSPKTAAWAWTLLGSIVAGVVTLLLMCIFD